MSVSTQAPNSTHPSPEIRSIRTYKTTKEVLFRLWSNPIHLSQWWGPHGFSVTTHEMEFKPGGTWRFSMNGPDGTSYPNLIRFTKITDDAIELDHIDHANDLYNFKIAVKFEEVGGETTVDFRLIFRTLEQKSEIVQTNGAEEGLAGTLQRLGDYSQTLPASQPELVIVRTFKASQKRVWDALTIPEQMAKWSAPHGTTISRSAGEVKAGSPWEITMKMGDMEMVANGEYVQVEPNRTLSYTHRWQKEDGSYKPTTLVTVHLHEHEGLTTLTFVQTGFWSEEARAAHFGGWSSTMHQLGVYLGEIEVEAAIHLNRVVKAPLELVFQCFTDPARIAEWNMPKPWKLENCVIDMKPGGEFSYEVVGPDSSGRHIMQAEICELEPPMSFGYVFTLLSEDGTVHARGANYVFLSEVEGGTSITVNAFNGALSEAGRFMVGGMETGWNMALDQLAEYLSSAR